MKKLLKCVVSLTLVSVIVCLFGITAFATGQDNTAIDSYEYSVTPGTIAWEELGTFSRRLDACRIPEETLDAMTTDALVDAVVNLSLIHI